MPAQPNATKDAKAIWPASLFKMYDIKLPVPINKAIFQINPFLFHDSCRKSLVVRSRPMKIKAVTIEADGPSFVMIRFADMIAPRYNVI